MTKVNVLSTATVENKKVLKTKEMINVKRNARVFIAGKNGVTGRVFVNMDTQEPKFTEYKEVVTATEKGATGINALNAMVKTMAQLKDLKDNGTTFTEPVIIYNLGMVADQIERGTFKYWLNTGARLNGTELTPIEMNLWTEFAGLYQELFLDVIIKNISTATPPKNSKYPVTAQQKFDGVIATRLWDKLPKEPVVAEFEEVDAF